jgi:hypothetical protein
MLVPPKPLLTESEGDSYPLHERSGLKIDFVGEMSEEIITIGVGLQKSVSLAFSIAFITLTLEKILYYITINDQLLPESREHIT